MKDMTNAHDAETGMVTPPDTSLGDLVDEKLERQVMEELLSEHAAWYRAERRSGRDPEDSDLEVVLALLDVLTHYDPNAIMVLVGKRREDGKG